VDASRVRISSSLAFAIDVAIAVPLLENSLVSRDASV
jgi:hypothetical protein